MVQWSPSQSSCSASLLSGSLRVAVSERIVAFCSSPSPFRMEESVAADGAANGVDEVQTAIDADMLQRLASDTAVDELFCKAVLDEAKQYRSSIFERQKVVGLTKKGWQCALCPYKHFVQCRSLVRHVDKQHIKNGAAIAQGRRRAAEDASRCGIGRVLLRERLRGRLRDMGQ